MHARVHALSVGSPTEIILLGALLSEHFEKDEKRLQKKLAAHRIKGEWFEADAVLFEMKVLLVVGSDRIFKIESSRDTRKTRLEFRASPDEVRRWQAAAEKENMALSEWIRQRGNSAVVAAGGVEAAS